MKRFIGYLLILVGLLCNQWELGSIFSPDGTINSPFFTVLIWSWELVLVTFGIAILVNGSVAGMRRLRISVGWILLIALFIVSAELLMGSWLSKDKGLRQLNIPHSVRWSYDVSNLYEYPGYTNYTRDAFGLRGSFSSPDQIAILTVGSSTTDNRMVTDGETWQDILQMSLFSEGETLFVANAGVNNYTVVGSIKSFEQWFPLIPDLKPRYIIFLSGIWEFVRPPAREFSLVLSTDNFTNRIQANSWFWLLKGKFEWLFPKPAKAVTKPDEIEWTTSGLLDSVAYDTLMAERLRQYQEDIITLIDHSRRLGATAVFVSQPLPVWSVRNGLVSGSADYGVKKVLTYEDKWINGVDSYHIMRRQDNMIARTAQENGAYFIDIARDTSWTASDWYDIDGHFSPRGSEKFGKILYQHLVPILEVDSLSEQSAGWKR